MFVRFRLFAGLSLALTTIMGTAGAAPVTAPQPRASSEAVLRGALGILGAGFCFQTYEAIASAGVVLAAKTQRDQAVAKRLGAVAATAGLALGALRKVEKVSLGGSDQLALSQMREALLPLRAAAQALARYAREPTRARFIAYENERVLAWRKLQALFRDE